MSVKKTHRELRLKFSVGTGYATRYRLVECWFGIMWPANQFRINTDERFFSFVLGPIFGAVVGPYKNRWKAPNK